MSDAPGPAVQCAGCAFWRHGRESEGVCRRRAPDTGARGEEVAHWPQTRAQQGCGDGVAAPTPSAAVTCGECVFWRRPAHGFSPVDRGDMPMSWWAHAGYCARHAPKPSSEPGARAFWRATSSADGCGEGATTFGAEPGRQ
jgi:hypothetical protein